MVPVVYFPFAQDPEGSFTLLARAAAPDAAAASLRAAVASVDPELPLFGIRTMTQMAAESNAMFLRAIVTRLLAWFSIAALALAGVGIYGILAGSHGGAHARDRFEDGARRHARRHRETGHPHRPGARGCRPRRRPHRVDARRPSRPVASLRGRASRPAVASRRPRRRGPGVPRCVCRPGPSRRPRPARDVTPARVTLTPRADGRTAICGSKFGDERFGLSSGHDYSSGIPRDGRGCRRHARDPLSAGAGRRVGLAGVRSASPYASDAGREPRAPGRRRDHQGEPADARRGAGAGQGARGGGPRPIHVVQHLRHHQTRGRAGADAGGQGWRAGLRRDEVPRRRRRARAAPHVCAGGRSARSAPDSLPGSRPLRERRHLEHRLRARRSSRSSRPTRRRRSSGTPTRSGPTSAPIITTRRRIRSGPIARGGITDKLLGDYPNLFGDLSANSGNNALSRDPRSRRTS